MSLSSVGSAFRSADEHGASTRAPSEVDREAVQPSGAGHFSHMVSVRGQRFAVKAPLLLVTSSNPAKVQADSAPGGHHKTELADS
jgi:hypothetical protein